ncbi:unnamed protein product [Cuscuta epithymum]|uniref:Myb/SANT-like DNA-binding domain-containing protein n=1 Tax=Cuscuta epithymum TaxID=186058 RepID=A0AAV0C081_9ASTE|nr:unnamed protein product [Cuscuta epithymum]CAH9139633.1 unnamed protein product [Cuscuta epithymum]
MESPTAQKKPRTNAGGREDCWSEGATETLVEAWGDRYIKLNRGNLRQNDWKEVADAVNARQDGVKPQRSDIQCKNRVDTLKKKYKLEKSKSSPSTWSLYDRLDYLIGTSGSVKPSSFNRKSAAIMSKFKPEPSLNLNPRSLVYSGGSSKLNSSGSDNSSRDGGEDYQLYGGTGRKRKHEYADLSEETSAYRELARAILNFGEMYERIESSKQQQIMELEKQRMKLSQELEVQRMHMFMEAQLLLAKPKRPSKHSPAGNEDVGKCATD